MKTINCTDEVELSYSTAKVVCYLLKIEAEHFVSSKCPSNHIFIDAVLMGQLGLASIGTRCLEIHKLTEELINEFDENKSDRLLSLVGSLLDYSDIISDFNGEVGLLDSIEIQENEG